MSRHRLKESNACTLFEKIPRKHQQINLFVDDSFINFQYTESNTEEVSP